MRQAPRLGDFSSPRLVLRHRLCNTTYRLLHGIANDPVSYALHSSRGRHPRGL